jgi:membrane-associated phospholipid phosphatase
MSIQGSGWRRPKQQPWRRSKDSKSEIILVMRLHNLKRMRQILRVVMFITLSASRALGGGDDDSQVLTPEDTSHVGTLGRKLSGDFLLDQKHIWSSPFRMNRHNAKWWILFGGATAALVATDKHTNTLFENSPAQVRWAEHVSNIGASYTLVPITAGFFTAGVFSDSAKARETGALGAEALLDSLVVQSVLKPITGRSRPNATRDKEWFEGGQSFPSGHTIETWSLASVIAHEYADRKWVPYVAYGLATVVGGARFTAHQHYASDILAGGAMGWFIGRYVYETHNDRPERGLRPEVAPLIQPSAGTYGISVKFPVR